VIKIIRAVKIRLLPTKEQEQKMFETINACRFTWNWGLAYSIKYYEENKKSISGRGICREFTKIKHQEFNWINNVSSKAYNNEFETLDIAFKKFFKKESKFPRFKKKKDTRQSFYIRNDVLVFNQTNCTLNIEKIGRVKYKSDRKIPKTKYMNPTCSFNGKYWILSFGIEIENQDVELSEESIGIDLGIKTLAVCSNGMTFGNINKSKKVKDLKKKLKRLQRQVSRKYQMNKDGNKFIKTNNIIKLEKKIRLLYKKLSDIRKTHLHQTTNKIIKQLPKRIVLENLNVKGMMKNRHLSKAIAECMFYEFRRQIEYKSKYYGIEVILADRFFPSSKMCCECGQIKSDLKLSDRTYICDCGNIIDRDMNGAINLSIYEIKTK
jgi:putative transposase